MRDDQERRMMVPPISLELPTGRPAAALGSLLLSVPGWRHGVRRGRPGISPQRIMGEYQDAAASPGQEAIVLHGIGKRFGSNLLVDNISFGVAAGEIVVLLGAKGAGKRTRELRCRPIHRRSE